MKSAYNFLRDFFQSWILELLVILCRLQPKCLPSNSLTIFVKLLLKRKQKKFILMKFQGNKLSQTAANKYQATAGISFSCTRRGYNSYHTGVNNQNLSIK